MTRGDDFNGFKGPGLVNGDAAFSIDRVYRYALWRFKLDRRTDHDAGCLLAIGTNPSDADERRNDPTMRRLLDFAARWGFSTLLMANLGAYVATKPRSLATVSDPVGPDCDAWIAKLAGWADYVLCAWGVPPKPLSRRPEEVLKVLGDRELYVLGLTKDGHPRHPLYVRADTVPMFWERHR